MKTDDNTLDVNEDIREDSRPTEVPVIVIERRGAGGSGEEPSRGRHGLRSRLYILSAVIAVIAVALVLLWSYRNESMSPGVPVSVSDDENIRLLEEPFTPSAKGSVVSHDSILGVAMDFYTLDGLRASLETEMPDTADTSLVLFMRSADYHPDKNPIGHVVVDGQALDTKESADRPGYIAISPEGRAVIGVSLSDRLRDNAAGSGGSFFRQFLLLSDGTLPADFRLHGKVERGAIGRMADGSLHYVVTRHKETMYDFADAMREYGFVDAVYLTGGNAYTFHRDTLGVAHINEATRGKIEKYSSTPLPAPLLVFRR